VASYEVREVTETRVQVYVPVGPYGACWTDIEQALDKARCEYHLRKGTDPMSMIADDAIMVRPGDDEIVIEFKVARQTDHGMPKTCAGGC
jgi:hypothetical protein